jgi:tetratricopeptide (TPR) repeat protein
MLKPHIRQITTVLVLAVLCGCARSPEARRDRFIAKGKEYLEKRDFARARLEFQNAVKAMPRDGDPYYYIGLTAVQSGDLQNAVYAFQKTLQVDPKHANAKLRLAQLMTMGNQGVVQDAANTVKELMQTTPVTPELLNTMAVVELKLGKTDDAVRTLEELLKTSPGYLNASILLARARLIQKDPKGAEEALKEAAERAPNNSEPQISLAAFFVATNRPAEAEQALHRALDMDAHNARALRDLAILQNKLGRKKDAEDTFKRLSGLGQEDYDPLYPLFLFSEGRKDEALRELERLVRVHPQGRAARTRLVSAYYGMNRTAEARKILDETLTKNKKDVEALLQRGQMLTQAGEYTKAEVDLNAVLQQSPDSPAGHFAMGKLYGAKGLSLQYRQSLTKALELNPALLFVRLELARALIAANSPKAALDVLDKTPEGQKTITVLEQRNWALWALADMKAMRQGIDAGLSRERSAELLVQDGLWKLRAGNAAAAGKSLEAALQLNPGDIRALTGLKQSYSAQRQLPAAVEKVKHYAAQQPKSAPVQQFLGLMLLASGDPQPARVAFMAAKAADPNYYQADLALTQMDAADRKWDAAIGRLNTLIAANPRNATAHLWLGVAELARNNQSAALKEFQTVVEINPDNAQALNNVAYLLSEHGNKPDEALKYATKAQELAPDHPLYMGTLGWILYRKGLYPESVKYLERAATKGKDPVIKYHLAMAYGKLGRFDRGRIVLGEALKGNPNLPEANAARELLAVH